KIVVVPRLVDSHRLVPLAMAGADPVRRIRLTTAARLRGFIARRAAADIAHIAADELRSRNPGFSAAEGRSRRMIVAAYAFLAVLVAVATPDLFAQALEFSLGLIFLAWTGLRLLGFASEPLLQRQPRSFADDWLPTYSVVIALYQEAAAIPDLV